MIKFSVLGTGSKGNSTFVEIDGCGILLDAGFPYKNIARRLAEIGRSPEDVTGIFVTHQHKDHAHELCLKNFYNKHGVETHMMYERKSHQHIAFDKYVITPYEMEHDVPCAGISVSDLSGNKLSLITDTNTIPCDSIDILMDVSALLIEVNHDTDILLNCEYSSLTKIRSSETHMDNFTAQTAIEMAASFGRLTHVVGMHISGNGNVPELALQAMQHGADSGDDFGAIVSLGDQDKPTNIMAVM